MAPRYNSRLWREVVDRFKGGENMERISNSSPYYSTTSGWRKYSVHDIEHIIRWWMKKSQRDPHAAAWVPVELDHGHPKAVRYENS